MSLNEKIREFKSLQEDRVREHKKLDLAFKTYLSSGPEYDFKTFQVAVGEATKSFKDTSNEILKLKSLLISEKEYENTFKQSIEEIQILEGEKLKETVEYQLLAQEANDDPDDDVADASAREKSKLLSQINEHIADAMEEIRYLLTDLEELDEGKD
ncbi:required for excision 1-B domain-containing protein-like [Lepeophtheirus salmonis]|uniref:required for excision 1-B domain-containing protein-like n=1 Tax=Lepeophtheirus salmonis TaxID=72036 RepID=UPI001AE16D39|nr:required for excision 1-B domain-containing protein-like [Lepeophtheirus salmonis]